MRKMLFLFLLAALLLVPNAGFAQTPFTDTGNTQAPADIEAVYQKGIMIGTAKDKFSPDEYVDRAQLAAVLMRTFNFNYDELNLAKQPAASDLYDDVENGLWYSDAAVIAGQNKLIKITGKQFRPVEPVTRMETASAIADSFKAKKLSVITTMMWPNYSDITALSQKEQADISFVFNTGIMRYMTGNEFKPHDKITRAELAMILNRTLKTLAVAEPVPATG